MTRLDDIRARVDREFVVRHGVGAMPSADRAYLLTMLDRARELLREGMEPATGLADLKWFADVNAFLRDLESQP